MTVKIALCDDETAEMEKTERLLNAYEQKYTSVDLMIECYENLSAQRDLPYSERVIF